MASSFASVLIDMGFSSDKVDRALAVTGNQGVEPAMEWLLAHCEELDSACPPPSEPMQQDSDPSRDGSSSAQGAQGGPSTSSGEASTVDGTAQNLEHAAKSLKCDECGKIFETQLEVEYHAAKSGHSQFSESTEEKKPLTEEQKKEQLKLLEQKLKEKKKEREEKEKAEALEREKHRIKAGKEFVAIKKKMEDEELKKAIELRKREKEEDKLARQRIKDQIEADKAARRAKAAGEAVPAPTATPASPSTTPVKAPPKDYSETRLQIRLTNGQSLTQTFGVKEQLSAVRLFIEMNRTDGNTPFSMMTTFPRKVFQEDDFDKPLDILGLVPSAVITVSKAGF